MWYLLTNKNSSQFELVQNCENSRYNYVWFTPKTYYRCLQNQQPQYESVEIWVRDRQATIIATFTETPTTSSIKQWFDDHPELFI